ncbi:MAG: cyclic nucleotide-binding domain-containing protein [Candidatus Xenobia bacterium]
MAHEAALLDKLRSIHMFSGLSDGAVQRLADAGKRETFQPGDVIVEEGAVGDTLYIILRGDVDVHKFLTRESREEILVGVMGEGSLFGEMALFEHLPRAATVRARTEVVTFALNRDAFEALLQREVQEAPIILRDVITTLAQRQRAMLEDLRTLYDVSHLLVSAEAVGELAEQTVDLLLRDIGSAGSAMLAAWPQAAEEATVVRARNLPPNGINEFALPSDHPLADEMRRKQEAFILSALPPDHVLAWMVPPGGDILVAPLLLNRRLIGFLALASTGDDSFTHSDGHLLTVVANQVAVAFAHAVQRQDEVERERMQRVFYGQR